VRTRLVIAFIVVALLSALASSWFHTLIGAYRLPAWLDDVILGPGWLQSLVHTAPGQAAPHPVRHTALVFFGVAAGLLLAIITALAIAASRPVLLPVRRLARAAQRMSGGDLSVRIQPRGRAASSAGHLVQRDGFCLGGQGGRAAADGGPRPAVRRRCVP
jgi:HAMP domain-containing protein